MKWITSFIVSLLVASVAIAQSYNNEWIDFNKTYFKFKIGSTGVYRIYSGDLTPTGWGDVPAQSFQLWRNGKEVALYSSTGNGPLGTTGYIEFWGEKNDGISDRNFYRNPSNQLSDKESLLTDTAAFFLTVNPAGNNLRFASAANNVAGNTATAEPYFLYALRYPFKQRIHRGQALVAGSEYVYSSTYDVGEMWASNDINPASPVSVNFTDLQVATGGPAATFRIAMAGSAPNIRSYNVQLNNNNVVDTSINIFEARINYNSAIPVSTIASNSANFRITNRSSNVNDRIVCSYFELTYPRLFNFGNQSSFSFSIPAS